MARVTVRLPSVLSQVVDGMRSLEVDAATVGEALATVVDRHPQLKVHLFDESGGFRDHVRCFHEATLLSDPRAQTPLAEAETLTILQSVAGGCPLQLDPLSAGGDVSEPLA